VEWRVQQEPQGDDFDPDREEGQLIFMWGHPSYDDYDQLTLNSFNDRMERHGWRYYLHAPDALVPTVLVDEAFGGTPWNR
jgi:hypothetical protein